MWRIYYFPDTGVIKYQINIEAVSQLEPLPYIDVTEKQDVTDKVIDLETLEIKTAEPGVKLAPAFTRPASRSIRELAAILRNKP